MAPTTRVEKVTASDGTNFDAHTVVAKSGSGPGILLLQEIFGVGAYIKAAAQRLGEMGYVVMAPDLFWRLERNVALDHDEEGLNAAMAFARRFDPEAAVTDCEASLDHLRALPEVDDGTGVLGFCLGGTLAYLLAARAKPDVAVSYYGSGVPGALELLDRIDCPILFHFGGSDPYIPRDQVDAVAAAVASHPPAEFHLHEDAGHAFDNHEAEMFHNPEAAAAAWRQTTDFLHRTLPAPTPASNVGLSDRPARPDSYR